MSYNILNKNVNFQGDTQGTIEDIVDTHSDQTINGLKTVTHLTGTNVRVTNDAVMLGNVSASLNISASAFYANGVLVNPAGGGIGFDGSTANGLLTYKNASEATVESNLTFDGSVLDFGASTISGSGVISGSAFYGNGVNLQQVNAATVTLASNSGLANSSGLIIDITNATEENTTDREDDYLLFYDNGVGLRKTKLKNVADLFNAAVTTYGGNTANNVIVANGVGDIQGQSNLTFDGSKLTVTGEISGSSIISGSIGHFVTKVEAGAISIGDATGLAGAGLTNTSGQLDIQVSGAIKLASDKLGITGSMAGDGLAFSGGSDSISSLSVDLKDLNSGLQFNSGELMIHLNNLTTGTPLYSADHIIFIDADDSVTKKTSISTFITNIAGDGLANNGTGRLEVQVTGAAIVVSDKVGISGSIAGNGLDYLGGVDSISALEVKVSDFMSNGANNRILTAGDANSINAETYLTFDGSILAVTGTISGSSVLEVGSHISSSGHLVMPNIPSGSIAGAGSYLGLGADGKVVLTSSAGGGGGAVSAVANGVDNRIATFSSTDALNGEANLTFDGTTLELTGNMQFSQPSDISDNSASGEIVNFGGGSTTAGKLYFFNSDGIWSETDANIPVSGSENLLGVALGSSPGTNGMLVRGLFDANTYLTNFTSSLPVYMSETAGAMTTLPPADHGIIKRVVGYCTNTPNVIYFSPSSEFSDVVRVPYPQQYWDGSQLSASIGNNVFVNATITTDNGIYENGFIDFGAAGNTFPALFNTPIDLSTSSDGTAGVYTFSLWFYSKRTGSDYGSILRQESGGTPTATENYPMVTWNTSDELGVFNETGGGTFYGSGYDMTALEGSTDWIHLVVVANGTNSKFYVDGVFVGTANAVVTTSVKELGAYDGNNTQVFSEGIDEFAYWDIALTETQVKAIYNSPSKLSVLLR